MEERATVMSEVPKLFDEHTAGLLFPILSMTNYHLWSERMKMLLEAHGLWDAVYSDRVPRKKDRLAMSTIFGAISEDLQLQFDEDNSSMET